MSISINDKILNLEEIKDKHIKNITFKESVSLLFHAVHNFYNYGNQDFEFWKYTYQQFLEELEHQNNVKWPNILIIKNQSNKCYEIVTNKPFIKSGNLLTLLMRLLYVEDCKARENFIDYFKILDYNISTIDVNISVDKILFTELLSCLKNYIRLYIKSYNDNKHFEYQLGRYIWNILND